MVSDPGVKRTDSPRSEIKSPLAIVAGGDARAFFFGTWYGASNPFLPSFIPREVSEIDVFAQFAIIENKSAGYLKISANLKGDNFPSTEAFITDPKGQSVFLGIGHYEGNDRNTAPFLYLPGANQRQIFRANLQIGIDGNGAFTNVVWGGRTFSIAEWNRRFVKENPHKKQ